MKKPEFSHLDAMDYIRDFGLKNALANLTPFYSDDLVFLVPADLLGDLAVLVERFTQLELKGN